jgi:chromosome partitioning protein
MKIISIAARKGGVGKSTISAHLSVIAASEGRSVLLFDTDPQGSLTWWWRLREGDAPALVECKAGELSGIIEAARRDGVGICIVDTPPHAENSILAAMRVADLVIVPTRPGPFDLAAVATTLDLARSIGKAPLAVLNHAPPQVAASEPSIVIEAREALRTMGADVAGPAIAQRVALSHAIIAGQTVNEYEPNGKAAAEMSALWRELETRMETI